MAYKLLDLSGLAYFWGKLKNYFQVKLVSGTNIKTVNNTSLLGSGNVSIPGDVTGVKGNAEANYRTGNINLTPADLGAAPINSPELIGTPRAPTPTSGDDSTRIATTAFVADALDYTDAERAFWNGKVTAYIDANNSEILVFNVGTAPTERELWNNKVTAYMDLNDSEKLILSKQAAPA